MLASKILTVASLLSVVNVVSSFIIAPAWVNPAINPCSKHSWQLIQWPGDQQCYRIFEQGPCPHSQELAFNAVTGAAECRCPKNLLYWAATNRCYAEYSRGPCEVNQYLERVNETEVRCRDTKICDNGWIFWPPEQECFQLYTQGPCHKGDLLIMNPVTVEPYCGCDPLLLNQYYFPALKLCYEHFTRGPCESGLLFAYNHTSQATHCLCHEDLAHYHSASQQCFQFGHKGPCQKGQIYEFRESTGRGECRCREGYVLWKENGECYKAYTSGPCRPGDILVPDSGESDGGRGVCVRNPCPRAHLYFPDSGIVPAGRRHRLDGSGGTCHKNYWPETGKCYEWYTRGPCPESYLFEYNKETGRTECVCDDQEGFVFWNETKQCYKVYTRGPCPENAWLIPSVDLSEVFCECRTGFFFSPSRYTCEPNSLAEPRRSSTRPYFGKQRKPGQSGQPSNWSDLKSDLFDDDHDGDDDDGAALDDGLEENSTESGPKSVDHYQGVFVNPRHRVAVSRRRQDSGDDDDDDPSSDAAQIDWMPGRHQWEFWRRLHHKN